MGSYPWRTIALDRGDHGVRVDRVLLRHLQDEHAVSRNRIQKWIESGAVLVNGGPPDRAAWRIQAGDDLRVRFEPRRQKSRPAAEAIPIDVLYEDDAVLVVNKPAGLVVHPSYKNATGTLMNGVLAHAAGWATGSKPALLGRLDKYTSGLVLIAKTRQAHAALQQAMDARRIDKDYFAVVWGKPSPARGSIDLALDRDPWDRRRITVTDRGGQPSVTKYERIATVGGEHAGRGDKPSGLSEGRGDKPFGLSEGRGDKPFGLSEGRGDKPLGLSEFSAVRCRLVTGRMHQIRVHLAARGWPIVGDAVYGQKTPRAIGPAANVARAFSRQALHAWRLTLRHPVSGNDLALVAPLPADLRALTQSLRLPGLSDRSE